MPTPIATPVRRASFWRMVLGLVLAAIGGLTAVNVVDWLSFRSALHVAERVSPEEWAAMFAKARELRQDNLRYLKGRELPVEFELLAVQEALFFQNHAWLRLYTRGEFEVYLGFHLNPEWKRITLGVSGTPDRSSTVWSADPALTARLEPKERVLTVTMDSYLQSRRTWIVLPSELRVVDEDTRSHTHSAVAFPLSQQHAEKIAAAVAAIPSGFRGRLHFAGGTHGNSLRLRFRADGQRGMEDVELANVWRDEVGALLDAISTVVSQGYEIDFKTHLVKNPLYDFGKYSSYTWAEIVASERPIMNFPWWCIWPRWFGDRARG